MYSDTDYRCLLFLLLHGISIARKEMHFFHLDIAEGNIMLQNVWNQESVSVKTDAEEFEIFGLRFVPKLIDFGERKTSDLRMLADEFERMVNLQKVPETRRPLLKFFGSLAFQDVSMSDPSNYAAVQELLRHPYFDIPEIKRLNRLEKRNQPLGRCVKCNTNAIQKFKGTCLKVCQKESCIETMQKIASFITK